MYIAVNSIESKIYTKGDISEAVPNFKEQVSALMKCYKCWDIF